MFTSDDRYGFADSQKFDIAQYTRPRGRLVKKLGYTTALNHKSPLIMCDLFKVNPKCKIIFKYIATKKT